MKLIVKVNSVTTLLLAAIFFPLFAFGQWGDTYRLKGKEKLSIEELKVLKSQLETSNKSNVISEALIVAVTASDTTSSRLARIALLTDLSQSTAGGGDSQKKIGNGKLGVAFVTKHFYGDLSFAVFTNDRSQVARRVADTAFFYNNLLLAQHQTGGLNEISGTLGINSFSFNKADTDAHGIWPWMRKNLGFQFSFRSSNQVWVKDSTALDVLVSASSALLTCQVLNCTIESEAVDHLQIFAYAGPTFRRLGGNYALDSKTETRKAFLGTNRIAFNGWEYGVRLELGPFYGQAYFTEFKRSENIEGFSGPQLAVKLGAAIKLDMIGRY